MFRKLAEAFAPKNEVKIEQPDPRISIEGLWVFPLGGDNFVSHTGPGYPRNAVLEYFESGNFIRCAWCLHPLTSEAAIFVLDNAEMTDQNTFLWLRGKCPITSPART